MRRWLIACASVLLGCALLAGVAAAAEEQARWRLEQPAPPPPPGVSQPPAAVPLGRVGDIEFWEPPGAAPQANRGLLITHGDGTAVAPGVWAYDGSGWHEIATTCGATDGRIAWGGPADFWTVSDQRPGQAPLNGAEPRLEDRSLCHFSDGQIVASYARPAFEAHSYEAMSGAACLAPQRPATSSEDCWFGGEALPAPQVGAFQLHWNGATVEAQPYPNQGDPVGAMRALENIIFESVAYNSGDARSEETSGRPPVLHYAKAETAMEPLAEELPLYSSPFESPGALEYLRLGSSEDELWAATGPNHETSGGEITVLRRVDGVWSQVFGPGSSESSPNRLPALFEADPDVVKSQQEEEELLGSEGDSQAEVEAIAPEPETEDAWIALAKHPVEQHQAEEVAVLVHISASGSVLGVELLPSEQERREHVHGVGVAGPLVCPAREDCWMANVNGWLYHFAREGERALPRSELPGFPEGKVIGEAERPLDEGSAQEVLDAPPLDDSGLQEEPPDYGGVFAEEKKLSKETNKVRLPLLTRMHSRLVKGTTLELSFHLAVSARMRLLAKRGRKLVAATPTRVLKAGNRRLLLRLNPRRWPTKLTLQTHALAPLPLVSSVTGEGANVTTETTQMLARPFALDGWTGGLP